MIFDTTTLEEDLAIWLKWHAIKPYPEVILDFKRSLKKALKQGESVLACLDAYVSFNSPVRAKQEGSNYTRNYARENVLRIMKAKNCTEQEANFILIQRNAKRSASQMKQSKYDFDYQTLLDETEKPEGAKTAIVTKEEVRFFKKRTEACKYLVEKFAYKSTECARTTIARSIIEGTSNSKGFRAFDLR